MNSYKCKVCGKEFDIYEGQVVAFCPYCGSKQTEDNFNKGENEIIVGGINVNSWLKRVEILLSDKEFYKADKLLERILDNDPTNSRAYLFKLLIDLQLSSLDEFEKCTTEIEQNSNFKKAYQFANDKEKEYLDSYNKRIRERNIDPLIFITNNVKFQACEIPRKSWIDGKTIGEAHFWNYTEATIIAVLDNDNVVHPSVGPDFELHSGNKLFFVLKDSITFDIVSSFLTYGVLNQGE